MNEDERNPEDSHSEASTSQMTSSPQEEAEAATSTTSTAETNAPPASEMVISAEQPTDTSSEEDSPPPGGEEPRESTVQSLVDSQEEPVSASTPEVAASNSDHSEQADSGAVSETAESSRSQGSSSPVVSAAPPGTETPVASLSPAEAADRLDPRMRKPALYKPRMDPGQTRFRPRQPMSDISLADIHYKNVDILIRFIDGQGRILPRRKTRISAKMQRRVKTAIKQARHLALLPYTPSHIRSVRRR